MQITEHNDVTRYSIKEIRRRVIPLAKKHGVHRMTLFGSYARGEADAASDIDLFIERGTLRGLIQYFALVHDLEDALKCHVDVVTSGIADKDFLSAIKREEILLYEE